MTTYDPDAPLLKVLLVGDSGVGKTSLLLRFTDGTFSENYVSNIGMDFKIRSVEVRGKMVQVQVWDTAGQERFRAITSSYYRGAHGIITVYDTSDRISFQNAKEWMSEIDRYSAAATNVLVGSKIDMQMSRQVTEEEGRKFAEGRKVPFFETSAKSGEQVEEAFMHLVNSAVDRLEGRAAAAEGTLKLAQGKKKKGFCMLL